MSFEDGFGSRTRVVDVDTGEEVELLELSPLLVDHPGFVAALSERVVRVANARHASYARVRRLDRPAADRLVLVSESLPGWRLSELLRVAATERIPIDTTVVIGLLRQLLPAVALFARNNRESAIGNLATERLLLTPQARLIITEHAFGPAIERLNANRDRLWREFRVVVAPAAGHARIDARADAHAVGVIALSLLTGRTLADDEYPAKLPELVEVLRERREGATVPLSAGMEHWLLRALQLDSRAAFQSPQEAHLAFESMLAGERSYVTTPAGLEAFVGRVGPLIDRDRVPPKPPTPEPILRLVEPASGRLAPPAEATLPDMEAAPSKPGPIVVSAPDVASTQVAPTPEPAPAVSARQPMPVGPEQASAPLAAAPSPALPAPAAGASAVTRTSLALTLVVLAMLQSGVLMWLWNHPPGSSPAGMGDLVVYSRPASARVIIDGEDRGVTPTTVQLPAGAHVLEIRVGSSDSRVIPVTIEAGVQTAQYIELQSVPLTGGLDLRSEPTGAKVSVDGQKRGVTPVRLTDLAPGNHELLFDAPSGSVKQRVHIDAGVTTQVTIRMPGQ
ncbi:MAG: PEGA domain-containing protein [Vicinamibacterales bacterium]